MNVFVETQNLSFATGSLSPGHRSGDGRTMSADGQPSPRTLLVQMSAGGLPTCRMLTKDEGQDEEEEVVTGMVTTEGVLLPDDQEGMQFEGTVVEAVEEVEDEEGLDEESMGSGVTMDDGGAALLCKVCGHRRCAAGTLGCNNAS